MKRPRTGRGQEGEWPRRVLVAPDKFKGTLTAAQAANAIVQGLKRVWRQACFTSVPVADGGEGFAEALCATSGRMRRMRTVDARGRPRTAAYGILRDRTTAVFDLAAASGLAQLPPGLRDPSRTSTYGSGLILRHLARSGMKTVIVGLGGSATTDGGIGLAAALGYLFLDRDGAPIPLNGSGLASLHLIEPPPALPQWRVIAAVDVDSPLYGIRGAAHCFAPQKGADPGQVLELDRGLRRLARVARKCLGRDHARRAGSGAAGGSGFGLMTFLGAELQSGFDIIRARLELDRLVRSHDVVVTGEGCLDATTLAGKAPGRLALLARAWRRPTYGVFGRIELKGPGRIFARATAVEDSLGRTAAATTVKAHQSRLAATAARMASGARPAPRSEPSFHPSAFHFHDRKAR